MLYYRVQPPGLTITRHTSSGAPSTLPVGFVFAWRSMSDAYPAWWFELRDPPATEVIEFEADNEMYFEGFSNTDGVAVRPIRERRRFPLGDH